MDTSMIDPSLLAEQTAVQHAQEVAEAEHDSELDAEGEEDEGDIDAEGEEWDEPEVDQSLYVPQEETQVSQGLPTVSVEDYDYGYEATQQHIDPAPTAHAVPEYHFALPPDHAAPASNATPRRRGRPPKSASAADIHAAATGPSSTPGIRRLISQNATPGPSSLRINGAGPSTRPARSATTPISRSRSTPSLTRTPSALTSARAAASTKAKGKGKAKPAAPASPAKDPLCSFCVGNEMKNRDGVPEKMVSCHKCGRSGHPTCLDMKPELGRTVMRYKWSCLECKVCEWCGSKGDDSKLLFCDGCDRGYHYTCSDPPMQGPPKGSFYCPPCKVERAERRAALKAGQPSFNGASSSNGIHNGKGKGRAVESHRDLDLSQHPAIKITHAHPQAPSQTQSQSRRGRPPKHPRYDDSSLFDVDAWDGDRRSASATPQPGHKKRKTQPKAGYVEDDGEAEDQYGEDDDGDDDDDDVSYSASPAPRLTVRLTVGGSNATRGRGTGRPRGRPLGSKNGSGRGRSRGRGGASAGGRFGAGAGEGSPYLDIPNFDDLQDEEAGDEPSMEVEEEEEERIPYGGIITGADADTSKTVITDSDKAAFERSAAAAEKRLGGPRVDTWDPLGAQTPVGDKEKEKSRKRKADDEENNGGAAMTPAPKIARGRSLRDRLLDKSVGLAASGSMPDLASPLTPLLPGQGVDTSTGSVVQVGTPTRSSAAANGGSYFALGANGAASPSTPATPGPSGNTEGDLSKSKGHTGQSLKINQIRFGNMDIDTWYSAPYPEEYQYVPDGRLWLCEFCLRYMHSGFQAGRHRLKCKARHPPGDEIYREGEVSVFEVDGRKNKIYCQQLCLLAKMFLESKTLYYDVEPFLFYVMTQVDDLGARFVGYFSKEKRSPLNNVSCIMTLPVRQRKGWGQLLIDFSYALSKKEERVGSPEKPLSGLGEVTYKTYWKLTVFRYLRDSVGEVYMDDISKATSMTLYDIYNTLKEQDMIRLYTPSPPPVLLPVAYRNRTPGRGRGRGRGRGGRRSTAAPRDANSQSEESDADKIPEKGTYRITFDREYVMAVLKQDEAKGKLQLRTERLKYHPFLVTRAVKEQQEKEAKELARIEAEEAEAEGNENIEATGASGEGQPESQVAGGDVEMDGSTAPSPQVNGEVASSRDADDGSKLELIAGQADAAILEQVEHLAGPSHQHDHRPRSTNGSPLKALSNGAAANGTASEAVAHGEDKETLRLVEALSNGGSPKRSMRKREGTASSVTGTPRRERITRSVMGEEESPLKGR